MRVRFAWKAGRRAVLRVRKNVDLRDWAECWRVILAIFLVPSYWPPRVTGGLPSSGRATTRQLGDVCRGRSSASAMGLPWALRKDLSYAAHPAERTATGHCERENGCLCLQGRRALVTRHRGLGLAFAWYGPLSLRRWYWSPHPRCTAKVFDAVGLSDLS